MKRAAFLDSRADEKYFGSASVEEGSGDQARSAFRAVELASEAIRYEEVSSQARNDRHPAQRI